MSQLRIRPVSGLFGPLPGRRLRLAPSPSRHGPHQQQRRTLVNEALTPLIDATAHAFASIHHAGGVPWYLTIPLVALGINVAVRLPMQLYMQSLDRRRAAIRPLVVAWSSRHASRPFAGPPERRTAHIVRETERSRKRVYKAWGVPLWKQFIPLSSMLPFVVVSEALRRLSGVSMFDSAAAAAADTGEVIAQAPSTLVDLSLQTGGCLWFTDLITPDAVLGLPLICSSLLAANLLSRMSVQQWRDILIERPAYQSTSQRLLSGVVRLSIFLPLIPLCVTHLPASVFLYWAANFAFQLVNVNLVRKILPEREKLLNWKPIQPKLISYVKRPQLEASQKKPVYNKNV
ncbi:mitochondrial export translocase Oxa2 [Cordyceps fumosorosea ARSEF 2679]|uniref:Mitochondrial export translocase Oxa2 n=1 Tax=Cordyceps fumosorosea (strain ARSEF 2679) TaxID=1081104 RepID=A0A167M863_CORFA|nr:mitochondrial export translocase Oxa2 [Cordyceps fumosorosea ARSEF 2679]OAA54052.1 mitochondrial export translocase Oxa2 [Cordyceps fumosorosea ARSEF 2679]